MKKLRIVLLVAAVLLLGLPPVFGMLTESQVRARAESMREEGRLIVTVDEFDRGWFTSRALLSIEPNLGSDPAREVLGAAEPLRVLADFKHGPISVHDGFFIGLSDLVARPAPDETTGANGTWPFDFEFHAQSTFTGNLNFVAEIPPFDTAIDALTVSFSGGRMHGTLAGDRTQVWVDMDALQYQQGPGTVSVLGVHASADVERISTYVNPGVMSVRVDRMSMDFGAPQTTTVFDLRALDLESSTALDEQGALMGGTAQLELERIRIGETEVTEARLETAAERLDVAALEAYSQAAARAAERIPSGAPVMDEIEPAVLRLLEAAPAFSIDTLRFNVNGEPFEASLQATTDAAALPPAGAADIRDLALWTGVLDGYAELTVAKSLAQQAAVAVVRSQIGGQMADGESMPPEQIDALAETQAGLAIAVLSAQGFIEDIGDTYRTELRLEDGRVTVNGQALPFGLP